MNSIQLRADELGVNENLPAFVISNSDLIAAIAEEVDLETVTNHELREIVLTVRKQLQHLNWQQLVAYSVNHLPFGLNQTGIAWDGHYPCIGCPDAMIETNCCYHQGECKSWEIYEARL